MHPDAIEATYMSIPVVEFEHLHKQIRKQSELLQEVLERCSCPDWLYVKITDVLAGNP